MLDEKKIKSLINLLDDPDRNVFEAVKSQLNKLGTEVVHYLEEAWGNSLDELFQSRIENITQNIQFNDVKNKLTNWVEDGANDLFKGALILAQYQYPDLNFNEIKNDIEKIKKDIWLEINIQLTALEKTKIINHVLFEVHGFSRNSSFHKSAQSHFLNNLIQTKKGSPISLAILYTCIAQSLDLPIYGVALPKNFILCYKNLSGSPFKEEIEDEVLFYINPFNKGVVFGKKEVEQFIKQQKLENKQAYFKPCSNKETLIILLKTLLEFYKHNLDQTKVNDYESLLKILYF